MTIDLDFILTCFLTALMLYFFLNLFFRFQTVVPMRDGVMISIVVFASMLQLGQSRAVPFYVFLILLSVGYVIHRVVFPARRHIVLIRHRDLRKAVDEHPGFAWKRSCGMCYILQHDRDQSIDLIEKASEKTPFRFRFRQLLAFYLVMTVILVLWRF